VAVDLLRRHTDTTGLSVLDYGCGRGEAMALFRDAGMTPTGVDIDPVCLDLASTHGETVPLEGDDPVAQFGENAFDVVASFHVLEHVECPKRILSGLRDVSREFVLLAVPNLRYLHLLCKRHIDLAIVNEGHLHGWDHWHLLNLAERHCGLELVEWGFDATILPVLSPLLDRCFGPRAAIWFETGLFRRMFPFHGVSVLGLFRRSAAGGR